MTLKLPRLQGRTPLTESDGTPAYSFHQWWAASAKAIEDAVLDIATTLARVKLGSSYTSGASISAADVGSDVTVTISAHTRIYADGTSVSVGGGTVTGLPFSTLYYIYYDDKALAGGAVTYAATTSSATAAQINGRHLVGSVTTPADGAPPKVGDNPRPPGVGELP